MHESTLQLVATAALPPGQAEAVVEHLDSCAGCRELLAEVVRASLLVSATSAAAASPIDWAPRSELTPGKRIGRYLVLEPLGAGAMGRVFLAYDPKLDRRIALKLIRSSSTGIGPDELRARLEREARAMARLAHPNVVAVHDVGETGDDVFVAMEYVPGKTLRDWLTDQPRSWREILDVFLAAGRGLAAAHSTGIIHRDFKPENVLVDDDGRVRVADFGLARVATASPETGLIPTNPEASGELGNTTGLVVGTPAYLAPEVYREQNADARSDLFSFCVALDEALHGERPFNGRSLADMQLAIAKGEIRDAPPGSAVPPWLRRAVRSGLNAQPEQRPAGMDAILAVLSRDPRIDQRRWLGALGGLLLVAAVVFGASRAASTRAQICQGGARKLAGVWDDSRRRTIAAAFTATSLPYASESLRAVEHVLDTWTGAWVQMHTSACEATRIHGEQSEELLDLRMQCLSERLEEAAALTRLFERADGEVVEKSVAAVTNLPPIAGCADARALRERDHLPDAPAQRARLEALQGTVADVHALYLAGKYEEGRTQARMALGDARTLGNRPLEARASETAGLFEQEAGDRPTARALFESAVLTGLAGGAYDVAATAATDLVYLRYLDGPDQFGFWDALAEATIARQGGSPRLEADRQYVRATALSAHGRFDEARQSSQEALRLWEELDGPTSHSAAKAHYVIGYVAARTRRLDDALIEYQRALAIDSALFGEFHPVVAQFEAGIAEILGELGRPAEALSRNRHAVAVLERSFGPDHPQLANVLSNVGDNLSDLGHPEEALRYHRQALAAWQKTAGEQSYGLVPPLAGVGEDLLALGRATEARGFLERAVRIAEQRPSEPHVLAQARFLLARSLVAARGDRVRAVALAKAARQQLVSEDSRSTKLLGEVNHWLRAVDER